MKKQELNNKLDSEKKNQTLQGKSAQSGTELADIKLKDDFQQLNAESSPESFTSILTSPEFAHPVNTSQKENIINYLQQTYGNANIQRLIQAKLKLGQPNDKYEQEADRIAEQVIRMPEPQAQQQQERERKEREEREDGGILLTKGVPDQTIKIPPVLESRINFIRGNGQPLPKSVRTFFELRFSYNFGQVRIHSNPAAAEIARMLNAKAFTVERDIVFGEKQYVPDTTVGKKLLAHELTHVIQKNVKTVQKKPVEAEKPRKLVVTNATEAAKKLHGLLKAEKGVGKDQIREVLFALPSELGKYAWLKQVEMEYNRIMGYQPYESAGVTRWVPIPRPRYEWGRHGEPGIKLVSRSPLRTDLEGALGKENAREFVDDLEAVTREKSATVEERLELVWKERAEKELTKEERAFAIARAMLPMRWPWREVRPFPLAQWLFSEKVWAVLCGGGYQIQYEYQALGGRVRIWLFRKPTNDEKLNWRTTGSTSYLQDIGKKIHFQLAYFYMDIGHMEYPSLLKLQEWTPLLANMYRRIVSYQNAWEELGKLTGTMEVIKKEIVDSGSKRIKYLWSEEERKALRGWRKVTP